MRGRLVAIGLIVFGLSVSCGVTPSMTPAVAPVPSAVRHRFTRHVTLTQSPSLSPGAAAARTATAPARPSGPPSPWSRLDVVLTTSSFTVAHVRPSGVGVSVLPNEPALTTMANLTPVGAPRVLLVVAESGDWLQVLLPLRPNGSVGWVRRADVDIATITTHIEIDRAAHRLRVFDGEAIVLDAPVAVGRAATPTPPGTFFVTELLRTPNPAGAYGPFAFTLSAYSNVFQRFGSGDGAVGLHGTNEPRAIGTDASHGCVRVGNDVIRQLAAMLPLGTPVVIR